MNVLWLTAFALTAAAAAAPQRVLTTLTLATFYEQIEHGLTAILFCQRSIARCAQLERDFSAAVPLLNSGADVAFAIVGEKQRAIARLLAVTPPSIVIFRNGALLERYIGSKVPIDFARYLDALALDPTRRPVDDQPVADDGVLRLAADDGAVEFEALLASASTVLVAFTTRDCSHCRRLAPQLARAVVQLRRDRSAGRIAEIDCDNVRAREQICKLHSLSAFPALLLFRRGQLLHRFAGARTAEAIAEHVRQYASMRMRTEL